MKLYQEITGKYEILFRQYIKGFRKPKCGPDVGTDTVWRKRSEGKSVAFRCFQRGMTRIASVYTLLANPQSIQSLSSVKMTF